MDARGVPHQRHGGGGALGQRRVGGWRQRRGGLGIEHWDGRRWHATPLPQLGLGAGSALLSSTSSAWPMSASNEVWADIAVLNSTGANPPGTIILRWNGRAWSRVRFPYVGTPSPRGV